MQQDFKVTSIHERGLEIQSVFYPTLPEETAKFVEEFRKLDYVYVQAVVALDETKATAQVRILIPWKRGIPEVQPTKEDDATATGSDDQSPAA
ncbi:MAG: hypothetical protein L0338_39650 [Acidobacteria bacterium]|nr:hypothetical protein [Acidobacteriota bacterium]